eukprot:COSAG01_NODE_1126_length_11588_cov_40.954652_3_plen_354_part_00
MHGLSPPLPAAAMAANSEERRYLRTLGVEASATPAQIKKAYRKLALKFHPDKDPSESAKAKFIEVHEAYEALTDEELRARMRARQEGLDKQMAKRQKMDEARRAQIAELEAREAEAEAAKAAARDRREAKARARQAVERLRREGLEKLEEMIRRDEAEAAAAAASRQGQGQGQGGRRPAPGGGGGDAGEAEVACVTAKWKRGVVVSPEELSAALARFGEVVKVVPLGVGKRGGGGGRKALVHFSSAAAAAAAVSAYRDAGEQGLDARLTLKRVPAGAEAQPTASNTVTAAAAAAPAPATKRSAPLAGVAAAASVAVSAPPAALMRQESDIMRRMREAAALQKAAAGSGGGGGT